MAQHFTGYNLSPNLFPILKNGCLRLFLLTLFSGGFLAKKAAGNRESTTSYYITSLKEKFISKSISKSGTWEDIGVLGFQMDLQNRY